MEKTLQFKPQSLLLEAFPTTKPSLFLRPSNIYLINRNPSLLLSLSNQSHTRYSIICARNNKRRSGSQSSRKFVLELIDFIVLNLNILPEPLVLVIREFGRGNGGGSGFLRGFGGGGSDGWRRKRKKNLWIIGFVMISCFALWLTMGKEMDGEVLWAFLGLSLLVVSFNGWKRGAKDWLLGFCSCAVLVAMGLKREDVQKWIKGCSVMQNGRRRNRGRAV